MNKKIPFIFIIVVIIVGLAIYLFELNSRNMKNNPVAVVPNVSIEVPKTDFVFNPQNCSYNIDNSIVTLVDGSSTQITPGTEDKTITSYFGNDVTGDFNNDGINDSAFLVTQETSGTGTFYYLTVALNNGSECLSTNAIFLGDRIAPQTTEYRDGAIIVNYLDRKSDEPMSALPSVGVSRYFKVENGSLTEIANPNLTLTSVYKNTEYGFELNLPGSWNGYSILKSNWNGTLLTAPGTKYEGPIVTIRNPKWTKENPWQDIPVMVFTPAQWQLVEAEEVGVSAAPIPPSKLGANSKYVFALPPRWIGFTDNLNQIETAEVVKSFKAD